MFGSQVPRNALFGELQADWRLEQKEKWWGTRWGCVLRNKTLSGERILQNECGEEAGR